ncbi:Site-specific DNA recombinase [Arachidicoccus rhizosphaerae]|uniref:Site-specific DNA recombinase n=2 Tax=Arachidicoccus rhizosphaerae TaxID=551991 RepID=A0A1H3YRQ3_9BACT|nr:Site-specific DNA recombinase [Arachidicoccus rhizosphaerae]
MMKSAYLYIRVSTDEQKRKGYSLPEQEGRLLKYCAVNNIEVKDIFREDFSAKDFNRPEWKKLIATIKKCRSQGPGNILFIKWDRFSRNTEYAYEMIGILRKLNVMAMAIDQPIDFDVPESAVMLAVYLSIPESENLRRALNTSNNIRKAKQLGRYPNKAPLGYINLTGLDGRKYIAPNPSKANIVKWSFQQLAKNTFTIEEVRRMALTRGLKCSRAHFWRIIRNPVYCGFVRLATQTEGTLLIRGIHAPIISEDLFFKVQHIVGSPKKLTGKTDELKATFPLKGYLICPDCSRKLRASYSRGRTKRYPYYHCSGDCKTRLSADLVNDNYYKALQQLELSKGASELFNLILEDTNIGADKTKYLSERKALISQLDQQEALIAKARMLFVEDKLKFDDFRECKKECQGVSGVLQKELNAITRKLKRLDQQTGSTPREIFYMFQFMDIADKKQLVSLLPPSAVDGRTGEVSININSALAKIVHHKF